MKQVFLTGSTGVIGSALVPFFLQEKGVRLYLLLRARSEEHLQERFQDLLAFWDLRPSDPLVGEQLHPIRGDVTQPLLGMPESRYRGLAAEVTHIIHAAGNVNLNQPLPEARRETVGGAHQVIAFAKTCQLNGRFQKLEYVSTVGVAGRTQGLMREAPMVAAAGFHNTYEAAKAEAETYVLQEIRSGFPATIHRPSMVVGDSRTGKIIHFQVFYHLSEFCSGRRTWGIVAKTGDFRLDIIPADYVARAMYLISSRQETIGQIFHLCCGPAHALGLSELSRSIRQCFQEHGEKLPTLRLLHPVWIRRLLPLICAIVPLKMRRSLQTLPFFLDYLEDAQTFDNARSQAFLSKEGLSAPAVEGYLGKVLQYYWDAKHPDPRLSQRN